MSGKLRTALASLLFATRSKRTGAADRFKGTSLKSLERGAVETSDASRDQEACRLADSDVFAAAADRDALQRHLAKLPASYLESGFSPSQVKEHMRLVGEAEKLKDGFVALHMEVKEEADEAGGGADMSASDSSCTSSAGGFSSLSSDGTDGGQVCKLDVSFACQSHLCRPDLVSALRHSGFSVAGLTLFDVRPSGSLGHTHLKVYRDDFSQELLESTFNSALKEKVHSKRSAGIAMGMGIGIGMGKSLAGTRRLSSELSRDGLLLDRRCDSENPSPSRCDSGSAFATSSLRGTHRRLKTVSTGDMENLLHALGTGGKRLSKADLDRFLLDPIKLELGPLIAMGASGEVRKGMYEGEEVAVKVLRRPVHGKDTEAVVAEFKREVLTLTACGECPHLLKFYGICMEVRSRLCIVTRFMKGGTLMNYLQKRKGKKLPLDELLEIAIDVAAGMEFLHRNGIMHRDLKSANVLLDGEGHAVVGDFGVAKLKGERGEMTKEVGTYRWMAPEAFGTSAWPVTYKSDVYSFGIVLWELVSLALPFDSYTPLQAAVAVTLSGIRPTIPEDCPSGLKVLIESCWDKTPAERPNFATVLSCLRKIRAATAKQNQGGVGKESVSR